MKIWSRFKTHVRINRSCARGPYMLCKDFYSVWFCAVAQIPRHLRQSQYQRQIAMEIDKCYICASVIQHFESVKCYAPFAPWKIGWDVLRTDTCTNTLQTYWLLLTTIIHVCGKFHEDRIIFGGSRLVTVDRRTDGKTDRQTDGVTDDNTPSVKYHRGVKKLK